MRWLNYHHLLYFWVVVREGSIARASRELGLTPQTISGQLRQLEQALGEPLLTRVGRNLVPSDAGRQVFEYADRIFPVGQELLETLEHRPPGLTRLTVGIVGSVPKLIAFRLLEPAFRWSRPLRLTCRQDSLDRLLLELSQRKLEVVLSDSPPRSGSPVKVFTHCLGQSTLSVFGAPALASRYRRNFPASLDGAPFVMTTRGTHVRRELERWFEAHGVAPRLVADFDDSAMMMVVSQAGIGLFAGHTAIASEIERRYQVQRIGGLAGVVERFYVLSISRQVAHPAVAAVLAAARRTLAT